MLLEPLFLGLVIGLLLGGKLTNFAHINFKYPHFVVLVFAAQTVAVYLFTEGVDRGSLIWAFYLTYPILILILLINRQIISLRLFAVGTILNFIVILANGGMPVNDFIMQNYVGGTTVGSNGEVGVLHILMNEGTSLKILADIIPLPRPFLSAGMISIGDILMMISVFIFAVQTMLSKNTTKV